MADRDLVGAKCIRGLKFNVVSLLSLALSYGTFLVLCRFEALPARDPVRRVLRRLCQQRRLSARQRPGGQHAVQREPAQAPLLCDQPPVAPQAFFWTIAKPGQEPVPTAIDEWPESTDADYRESRLAAASHFYYVSPTVFPKVHVNTFGVGAPLAGLPVHAVLDLFVDIEHDRFWWWHGGALTASLLTALAALFVFLAARGFVQPVPAVLIALAFGLGSCAWPVSSQALWQHPASTFLLSLGAWLLLRNEGRPLAAAWCGAALGMAVLCRPTVAVVALCTAAYLLCVDRRRRAAFVPAMQFVGAYSYSLMGWSDLWREYDRPEQASLWRWDRPQIGYHLAHFNSERARKKQVMATYLHYPGANPQPAQSQSKHFSITATHRRPPPPHPSCWATLRGELHAGIGGPHDQLRGGMGSLQSTLVPRSDRRISNAKPRRS